MCVCCALPNLPRLVWMIMRGNLGVHRWRPVALHAPSFHDKDGNLDKCGFGSRKLGVFGAVGSADWRDKARRCLSGLFKLRIKQENSSCNTGGEKPDAGGERGSTQAQRQRTDTKHIQGTQYGSRDGYRCTFWVPEVCFKRQYFPEI